MNTVMNDLHGSAPGISDDAGDPADYQVGILSARCLETSRVPRRGRVNGSETSIAVRKARSNTSAVQQIAAVNAVRIGFINNALAAAREAVIPAPINGAAAVVASHFEAAGHPVTAVARRAAQDAPVAVPAVAAAVPAAAVPAAAAVAAVVPAAAAAGGVRAAAAGPASIAAPGPAGVPVAANSPFPRLTLGQISGYEALIDMRYVPEIGDISFRQVSEFCLPKNAIPIAATSSLTDAIEVIKRYMPNHKCEGGSSRTKGNPYFFTKSFQCKLLSFDEMRITNLLIREGLRQSEFSTKLGECPCRLKIAVRNEVGETFKEIPSGVVNVLSTTKRPISVRR